MNFLESLILDGVLRHKRQIFHFATGGLGHFLALLEGTIETSLRYGIAVQVVSEHHKPLGFKSFSTLFDVALPGLNITSASAVPGLTDTPFRVPRRPGGGRDPYSVVAGNMTRRLVRIDRPSLGLVARDPVWTVGAPGKVKPRFAMSLDALALSVEVAGEVSKVVSEASVFSDSHIGLHLRTTDRHTEFDKTLDQLDATVGELGINRVWVSSDSDLALEKIESVRPDLDFRYFQKPFVSSGKNLHYGVETDDAYPQLVYALADLFLLARSTRFVPAVGSGTAWTPMVSVLRAQPRSFFSKVTVSQPEAR